MPATRVIFYQEIDGSVPILEWLDRLPKKARAKCAARLARLSEQGHELRRPDADYLRDEIYELRVALRGQNYRMLYFFHGQAITVVSHGLVKERAVPAKEIDRAIARKKAFAENPDLHTYKGEARDETENQ